MAKQCPFNERKFCEENGYCSDGKECAAWIQPKSISDLCLSGWCEQTMYFGKEVYLIKECEDGRCPYMGCGRIEQVERLPAKALLAIARYQAQMNAEEEKTNYGATTIV